MKEMNLRQQRLRMGALAMAVAAVFALGNHGFSQTIPANQSVAALEQRMLIPGGKVVGIAIETDGLVLVGTSDLGSAESPARQAGLKPGDVIVKVNGEDVGSSEELAQLLDAGETVQLEYRRDGESRTIEITPIADPRDGNAKIGAWVRSGTAGVGTISYIDPVSGEYAALGHPISDVDTGILLPVADGGIYECEIVRINRGSKGVPGELVGDFLTQDEALGTINRNTNTGIYGIYNSADIDELLYPGGVPVGRKEDVHTGAAQIIADVDNEVRAYDAEIEHIESLSSRDMRSMVLHITDPELIQKTGGIVQGMSGSPIIQDGKLVGAVTHVLVNDPTRGYGIFIENMLEAAS